MSGQKESGEHQVLVPDAQRAGRADKVLAGLVPELSRSRWQKLFAAGLVWKDERVLSQKDRLAPGDLVEFTVPPPEPLGLEPVPMDLSVIFEDTAILVLDKEAGRVVHPGAGTGADTLVHGLLHHCKGSLSGIGGTARPGIVHRLDKETSGILVIAKSDEAFASLAQQFAERRVSKFYTALVSGIPDPDSGSIEVPIGRHPVHRTRMTCRKDGRQARTDYSIERRWNPAASLVYLQIHTGRTHQIRVHMKAVGHPLLGDSLYGYRPAAHGLKELAVPRIMLHATRLIIEHPTNGKEMEFQAPLPADMREVMCTLDTQFPIAESH